LAGTMQKVRKIVENAKQKEEGKAIPVEAGTV
jgi:hypothetical protein